MEWDPMKVLGVGTVAIDVVLRGVIGNRDY